MPSGHHCWRFDPVAMATAGRPVTLAKPPFAVSAKATDFRVDSTSRECVARQWAFVNRQEARRVH